jgi:predicted nucleic acid-binding protein
LDKITINYYDNKLNFHNVAPSEYASIKRLWIDVREDYTDWVANFKVDSAINGENISEALEWKGMTTWWLNQITTKDVEINNAWINRIMVLYLCREFNCEIYTNDKILIDSLDKNSKQLHSYVIYRSRFFKDRAV